MTRSPEYNPGIARLKRPSRDMRVLLLHPEDTPFDRRWSASHWDLIVDLGWAGRSQYQVWTKQLACPVRALFGFADWQQDVRQIQQMLQLGNGRLVDAEGIDWWALLAPGAFQRFYEFWLLQKLAREIGTSPELYVTRAHPWTETLAKLLGTKATTLSGSPQNGFASRLRRYRTALRTLTPRQLTMIAGDKWDTDYRIRRFLATKRKSEPGAKVLLPSAYRNVSRIAVSYASLLPKKSFLLVTTRADGFLANLPRNVQAVTLAAYAQVPRIQSTEREIAALSARWKVLKENLQQAQDPALTYAAGLFADLPRALRNGLRIRDAWRKVFERESISAVLCGDENNPYTRLPVLLARKRGVWTINCSHGALDITVMLRGPCADVYLAKGEMEQDYLVEQCGVPRERIFVGAPPLECRPARESRGTDIVFFSEPYELYFGRTETFYRELLPNLCEVARKHSRKVVLKLHPFESARARSNLVDHVLAGSDRRLVEISAEPMSQRLLQRTWFGVTVESSTAVECAVAGVPCFLCGWFDLDLHAYGKQYQKFGAAQILDRHTDILRIPDSLGLAPRPEATERLHHPITPGDLKTIMQTRDIVQA